MKRRIIGLTLVTLLILSMVPFASQAAYTPPTSFGAPEDVAVRYHKTWNEEDWDGFDVTVTASDELRAFVDVVGADNSIFKSSGFYLSDMLLQMDYKVDNGNWHYQSQWDEDLDYNTNKSRIGIEKGTYSNYSVFIKSQFESVSTGDTIPDKKTFFDNLTMDIKVRFIVSYRDNNGTYYRYASPWSQSVPFSNNQTVEDPDKLINHVPVLKSAQLKTYPDGRPYLNIITEKSHGDLQHLNEISGNSVMTEVWLKAGTGEWEMCGTNNFVEEFNIDAAANFGLKDSYDAAVYGIKFRYVFDYKDYPAAGRASGDIIYSPFSNIISHGIPAYSAASAWAKAELDEAMEYGLIPASLISEDMIKNITREEFAEIAVKLYEKTKGTTAVAVSPNPFTDTTNPEVLKAFQLKITTGISAAKFSPKEVISREQAATMLSRAIRIMVPDGDYSTAGAQAFVDQRDISSWALEHVLYMSKIGIIKGAYGKFMPRAITSAQIAAGYANTTREQAIAMSVRIYNQHNIDK